MAMIFADNGSTGISFVLVHPREARFTLESVTLMVSSLLLLRVMPEATFSGQMRVQMAQKAGSGEANH